MGFQPHLALQAMGATELADEDEVIPLRRGEPSSPLWGGDGGGGVSATF
jgi:hypothetical protein